MHTFFVNTSEKINLSYHKQLFDSLMSDNLLKVFGYPLDNLNACAEEIAGIITRNDSIAEIYNIIVYVESPGKDTDSLAFEKAVCMVIEETLFSRLYKLGRKPNQALILFGENFTRGERYAEGKNAQQRVQNALWELFPLADVETTKAILVNRGKKRPDESEEQYADSVVKLLTENHSEGALLRPDYRFVKAVLTLMAGAVFQNDDADAEELKSVLYKGMTQQRDNVLRPATQERVRCAHVRLESSDYNATKRSEFRVLFYVYCCADTESIELCEGYRSALDAEALGKDTIPDIEWEALSTELKRKKDIFNRELNHLKDGDNGFPAFKEEILDVSAGQSVKVNATNTLGVEMPSLDVNVKAHSGLTVSQLEKAVSETLRDIEDKNAANARAIVNYITIATDAFNVEKDNRMKNVQYKDGEKLIKSIPLTRSFIRKKMDEADGAIASRKRLAAKNLHVDGLLKEAHAKIDYYFECLKKGLLLYIAAVVFVLSFAVPYALIQKNVFGVLYGWLFYLITVAVIIGAFSAGYLIFRMIFKSRILKNLKDVCNEFRTMQEDKKVCLNNYTTLLTNAIPASYCLTLYSREFEEYAARRELIPELITYHTVRLNEYGQYIDNLLSWLDIDSKGKEPEDVGYHCEISVESDVYQNNTVYRIADLESDRLKNCRLLVWKEAGINV